MENPGRQISFVCFFLDDTIIITYERIGETVTKCLCIERDTMKITEKQLCVRLIKESSTLLKTFNMELFLGILVLNDLPIMFYVEEAEEICRIEGQVVKEVRKVGRQRIKTVFNTNFTAQQVKQASEMAEQISQMMENGGYYFSIGYDLTRSKEYAAANPDRQEKFMWNFHMMSQLTMQKVSSNWIVPIIQGYVGSFQHHVTTDAAITYILISRRSSKRAGTRFFSRGIDDIGQVSNFVESQQLVYFQNLTLSHVQIRGSVPAFWQQTGIDGILSSLKITRTIQLTESAFLCHFLKLRKTYKRFLCVNLLSLQKSPQAQLTEFFQKCIKKTENELGSFVKYQFFDFHQKCKNNSFQGCNQLLHRLRIINESFKFYCFDDATSKQLSKQQGVIRTNCLDCLDRTNFTQTKIAVQTLESILRKIGMKFSRALIQELDKSDSIQLVSKFKILWADNGDTISHHYTGIGSTHTDITRQGKRSLFGLINHKWKSLNRFYKQFTDVRKQEIINTMLGQISQEGTFEKQISKQLKQNQRLFSSYVEATFMIISWNVEEHEPVSNLDRIFNFGDKQPDIIVMGLQKVKQSLMGQFFKNDSSKSWTKNFDEYLKKIGYVNVSTEAAGNCLLIIYFRPSHKGLHLSHISDISTSKMKLNLMSYDKFILMTRMKIMNTSMVFANFFFTNAADFLDSIEEIHEDAFQNWTLGHQKQTKIQKLDYKFLFGHVGDSIQCLPLTLRQKLDSYLRARQSRDQKNATIFLNQITQMDMINKQKNNDSYLRNYSEGPLVFLPTSSIDIDRSYQNDKKPSWSERIFISNDQNSIVKQLFYKPLEIYETRNLPVSSLYVIELKYEHGDKLKEVKHKIINEG